MTKCNIFYYYIIISLSTLVLNSRDWSEIVWLPEISRFKINLAISFIRKKPAGMHWLGYNDAVSSLNEAKTQVLQPTANFENFKIHTVFRQPASLPAVRPGCARCRAPEISHDKGNGAGGFMKMLFRRWFTHCAMAIPFILLSPSLFFFIPLARCESQGRIQTFEKGGAQRQEGYSVSSRGSGGRSPPEAVGLFILRSTKMLLNATFVQQCLR